MSNENLNKTGGWKSELESLESWPGEAMPDKNAAYEKLHSRLRDKKNNKKTVWYWAAAACLLFAISISLIFRKETNHPVAVIEKEQNHQQKLTDDTNATPVQKKSVAIVAPAIEKEGGIASLDKTIKKVPGKVQVDVADDIRLQDAVSSTDLAKETIGNLLQPVDTAASTIAVVPIEKKKLKVVHINEMGDPVNESGETVSKKDLRYFRLKLASQEVYNQFPVAINKDGLTIFKTKSSSN